MSQGVQEDWRTKQRFLVALLTTTFIIAIFLVINQGDSTQTPYPSPEPNGSITSTHWKTYTTKTYSYKLPPEVNDFRCDMSTCWLTSTKLPAGSTISIGAGGPGTMMTEKTWQGLQEELRIKNVNYFERDISGKEAIYLITKEYLTPFSTPYRAENQTFQGIIINLDEGRWMSVFIYNYKFDTKDKEFKSLNPSAKELETFNQILSTLQFIE